MLNKNYIDKSRFDKLRNNRKSLPLHPLVDYLNSYVDHTSVSKMDLKNKIRSIYDQGQIGSCTANAVCQSMRMCQKYQDFEPSRLFLYAKERLAEGETTLSDSGADAEDGLEQLKNYGVCPESDWPYDESKVNVVPPSNCDVDALNYKVHTIGRICSDYANSSTKINGIKKSIIAGIPILIGIEVYSSFESEQVAQTGDVPIPLPDEECVGGHEVLIIGFDDENKKFILVNSWGVNWGNQGYFTLDYDYVTNTQLSSELIMITSA